MYINNGKYYNGRALTHFRQFTTFHTFYSDYSYEKKRCFLKSKHDQHCLGNVAHVVRNVFLLDLFCTRIELNLSKNCNDTVVKTVYKNVVSLKSQNKQPVIYKTG